MSIKKFLDGLRAKTLGQNVKNFEHFPTLDPMGQVSPGGIFDATFNIRIVRNSANIAQPLQVGILGSSQIASAYQGLIVLPAGGTLAVTGGTWNNLPDRYRFTYTVGANVDTIDIFCPEIPYPSFLQNAMVDRYRINNIRYVISDGLIQAQFNNLLDFRDSGIFGLKKSNPLVPSTFINPQDEKDNVVDIPVGEGFDKEKCIIHAIEPQVGFEVNMTMFIEFADKFTAKAVGL